MRPATLVGPFDALFRAKRRFDEARFELNRTLESWVRGTGDHALVVGQLAALRIAQDGLEGAVGAAGVGGEPMGIGDGSSSEPPLVAPYTGASFTRKRNDQARNPV